MVRVLVCGGREFSNDLMMAAVLDHLHSIHQFSHVIEGEQRGADVMARDWALSRGIEVVPFPADWNKYHRAAGGIRNTRMLNEGKPDLVVAFPGHTGTMDMVRKSKERGVPVIYALDVWKAGLTASL